MDRTEKILQYSNLAQVSKVLENPPDIKLYNGSCGCSSVVVFLPSIHKDLGSILSTENQPTNQGKVVFKKKGIVLYLAKQVANLLCSQGCSCIPASRFFHPSAGIIVYATTSCFDVVQGTKSRTSCMLGKQVYQLSYILKLKGGILSLHCLHSNSTCHPQCFSYYHQGMLMEFTTWKRSHGMDIAFRKIIFATVLI